MNLTDTPLEQIGASAHGHYKVAEKASGKAEEHYKSAGIYLKHAKLRVLKTRGLTWQSWLQDHCPISRSRADEVIAISDGRRALDEVREQKNKSSKAAHAKTRTDAKAYQNRHCSAADRSEKPNENNEGATNQQPASDEADAVNDALMEEVIAMVQKMDTKQLLVTKGYLCAIEQ